ncbi:23S rRNA (cytidine(2498)-2'-O)-methyltransferase RlmM [Aggregicoccus sp. 17bor-14]|uniref:23S rRNA (cytidine(2498)-2'-O)-methyltransferase RlmM n=1 Tax=Myxococcaceae TaxID=31 RepID=UPI00351A64D4
MRAPPLPREPLLPRAGRFLWTCRAGFEAHLFEELAWAGAAPRLVAEALVESDVRAGLLPAFARQGLRVLEAFAPSAPEAAPALLAGRLLGAVGKAPFALQAFTPDTAAANPLASEAEALRDAVAAALPEGRVLAEPERARDAGGLLVSLVLAPGLLAVGSAPAREALSLAPGGRQRMRREADAPSRAAMKLEEALHALPLEPARGDVCVDLGAAPGGWTQRLVARGARVIAVDPAKLLPELARNPRVRHEQASAFSYEPEEPVDWLFCDMAWRPLEVAQLLAKWGRRGWADQLVANIKLPMDDKNPVLVRVRHTLEQDGGWQGLRVRQLYHDRDEVTVTARRR